MEKKLLNYLITLSKIEELVELNNNQDEAEFLNKIINIRKDCVDTILDFNLVKLILKINNEKLPSEYGLKNQINDLSNMLGGEQEIDINNFDPKVFDTFGKGIGSLFNITPPVDTTKQIKNEINNNNNNTTLSFQIKKK